jgi:hypothetical protein
MAQTFCDRPAAAALQAYKILADRAANHETIQYREFAERMNHGASNFLFAPLGRVMRWCSRKGLPSLTALVITEEDPALPPGSSSPERGHVFALDWSSVAFPTLDELAA